MCEGVKSCAAVLRVSVTVASIGVFQMLRSNRRFAITGSRSPMYGPRL